MPKAEKKTRSTKTPAERAQEALDTQKRVVAGIKGRLEKAEAEVVSHREQLAAAERKLAYLGQNPDLPEQPADTPDATVETPA